MATITSNGTGGGRWSLTTTWAGGVLPADNDTVVIAAGDVVDMDLDLTGWATGINGITITSHATTPGELRCYEGAPGKYGFKLKANTVIQGTNLTTRGILRAGTSRETPLPQNIAFEIVLGGSGTNEMAQVQSRYLQLQVFCAEPTIKYVQLTSAALAGDTVLNVDQDVTADATRPWEANDYVFMANAVKSGTRTTEVKQIASVSSTTITLSAGLTYALPQYSVIALRTRNVRILINSLQSTGKDAVTSLGTQDTKNSLFCEMTVTLFTGGSGAGTSGWPWIQATHGRVRGNYQVSSYPLHEEGGTRTGLETTCGSEVGRGFNFVDMVVLACGNTGTTTAALNGSSIVALATAVGSGSHFFDGTVKVFCGVRGIQNLQGVCDAQSRVEWCEHALGEYSTGNFTWNGTIANCTRLGKSGRVILGKSARIGVNCDSGLQLESGIWYAYGCRINHATPVNSYLGFFGNTPGVLGSVICYDYADSFDVPQRGQIKAWMSGGRVEPDTTPASPPSGLVDAFCHKMIHESINQRVLIDIPVVLEAGTPYEATFFVKLGSAAYSWLSVPSIALYSADSGPVSDVDLLASAIDSVGDTLNPATTDWQTLRIIYTPPVSSNQPRGAKLQARIRVQAWVSNATGTPYWHWNYTQGAVVNANVQYVSGVEAESSVAGVLDANVTHVGGVTENLLRDDDARLDSLDAAISGVASAVWATAIEAGYTAEEILKLTAAVLLGESNGLPSSPVFTGLDGTTSRVAASLDSNGNRSSVTLDPN